MPTEAAATARVRESLRNMGEILDLAVIGKAKGRCQEGQGMLNVPECSLQQAMLPVRNNLLGWEGVATIRRVGQAFLTPRLVLLRCLD
jgi:hypothetical protein